MSMATHSLSYFVKPPSGNVPTRTALIFLIPGNPGLIDYYEPFLSSLALLLESSDASKSTQFQVYGQDLAGFNDLDHKPFSSSRPPRDVEYQIKHLLGVLSSVRVQEGINKGEPYDDVILMGHSVGSYMAVELFHRLLRAPESAPHLHLKTGFMLFPTIEHIAHSPSGTRLNLLKRTPIVGRNAHLIAKGFLFLWPYVALHWFVSTILGFPQHAATVTTNFLKSRDGVWQALYMGMDEMEVIGEDTWDEELWEIADEAHAHHKSPPKFYFFFGNNDHWVASHLRDAFIVKRDKQVDRTKVMVDEGDLPHAFCIKHSKIVAEKVRGWINETYA
ncbi:uncharacterized protein BCR38DRAFT_416668 [Pseudomassariella vexata]|uniref:Alpha/Beta hydrolase protein n=1 Tax=Pseudomassariella vexata TaxID=1141098 RepID=A0A1Y2EIJ4_9PEZI|nr:uncharacterized protein BCR38DRAFT_416668 [Pseudomassariella vexata]ORY71390.1 hypothetical protein BCR38DRAFT_416668 [Pseudomassariella vexata]